LKDRLTEKDSYYHGELEKAQTNADRDIFDLRRKLDKIDLSYQDRMEKLTEKYEKEIGEDHEEGFRNGRTVSEFVQFHVTVILQQLVVVRPIKKCPTGIESAVHYICHKDIPTLCPD